MLYAVVPPVAETVAAPSLLPLQLTLVELEIVVTTAFVVPPSIYSPRSVSLVLTIHLRVYLVYRS